MPKTPEPEYPDSVLVTDLETGEQIVSPALIDLEEHLALMANYLTPEGGERPDPVPIAPPVGYKRQPSLVDNIRAMIREHAVAVALAGQEAESFEEADDFDVQDDYDPHSPWEGEFEPVADINRDILDPNSPRAKKPVAERPPAPAEQTPEASPPATPAPPKPDDA